MVRDDGLGAAMASAYNRDLATAAQKTADDLKAQVAYLMRRDTEMEARMRVLEGDLR